MLIEECVLETGRVRHTKTRYGRFKCDVCGREYDRPMSRRHDGRDLCSLRCTNLGRFHTEEWKLAMSQRMQGKGNHFYGRHHSNETRELISRQVSARCTALSEEERQLKYSRSISGEANPFYGKHHNEATRQRMSETRTRKINEGEITCGSRGRKGTYVSTKTGAIERYDSFFELLRMQLLDADIDVISWTKKHGVIIPYVFNDSTHRYTPDFLIDYCDSSVLEEIKGYEQEDKLCAKMDALAKYCLEHHCSMRYIDSQVLETLVRSHFGVTIVTMRRRYKS
jgi:hypothetical protein